MERIWIYYYSFLAIALIVAICYYLVVGIAKNAYEREHYIGVNLTKDNGTCRITWLGGWDFDSIYTNVTVNGVNMGHPKPMTVIYDDICKNLTVRMHDKSVHYDMLLYQYNYPEVPT